MHFTFPPLLYLSFLALIPLALYLFKRKAQTVRVSSLLFFKLLAKEHQEAEWLRRLKRLLSLLLTLLILLAAVFALARPVFSPRAGAVNSVVILLDRSASMEAKDAQGLSRMASAKNLVRSRLAALPESVAVTLMAYDSRPEVVQPSTKNRREVLRALDAVQVKPLEDQADNARLAAGKLAALKTPALVWQVTDQRPTPAEPAEEEKAAASAVASPAPPPEMKSDLPPGVEWQMLSVGLSQPVNVGISAFQVRPVPLTPNKFEAFVQVVASETMAQAVAVTLDVRIGGNPLQVRELDLKPGQRQGLVLPLEGAEGQILEVEVKALGDCLAADNIALAKLPPSRPLQVTWVTENPDPFTQLALNAIAEEGVVQVWKAAPAAWPVKEKSDVVIFDHWLPKEWPRDVPALIVINPPGALGPVRAVALKNAIPHDTVRAANEEHPVLFRVSSSRVGIMQTSVLDASGLLEPLWFSGNEPVLLAGEADGQRLVVMGFAPMQSEGLPLSASYPLLVGNSLLWCAEPSNKGPDSNQALVRRTGSIVPVTGDRLSWQEWRNGALTSNDQALPQPVALLDRIGLWSAGEQQSGSALLLSLHESTLRGATAATADSVGKTQGSSFGWLGGEATRALLWLIFAILLIESWLFHRHAVY